VASAWGDSWGSSWGDSWGAAVAERVDRGGDGFPGHGAKKKRKKAHGRVRYLVYADERVESVPVKPEGTPEPVTASVVEEAVEAIAERLGWTVPKARQALPQVVYFKKPPNRNDRKELVRAIAEYLRREAEAQAEEEDIELLLLAAA
jgi:hypothetical protein